MRYKYFKSTTTLVTLFFSFMAIAVAKDTSKRTTTDKLQHFATQDQSSKVYLEQFRLHRNTFYKHYNTLVGDSDLRINCGKRKPDWAPISLRKKDYCEPQFVYNLEYKATQNELAGVPFDRLNRTLIFAASPFKQKMKLKQQQMAVLMTKLVNENPELKTKFQHFIQAERVYEANR